MKKLPSFFYYFSLMSSIVTLSMPLWSSDILNEYQDQKRDYLSDQKGKRKLFSGAENDNPALRESPFQDSQNPYKYAKIQSPTQEGDDENFFKLTEENIKEISEKESNISPHSSSLKSGDEVLTPLEENHRSRDLIYPQRDIQATADKALDYINPNSPPQRTIIANI